MGKLKTIIKSLKHRDSEFTMWMTAGSAGRPHTLHQIMSACLCGSLYKMIFLTNKFSGLIKNLGNEQRK